MGENLSFLVPTKIRPHKNIFPTIMTVPRPLTL